MWHADFSSPPWRCAPHQALLNLLRHTDNDDLTDVLLRFIEKFSEHFLHVAVEISEELVTVRALVAPAQCARALALAMSHLRMLRLACLQMLRLACLPLDASLPPALLSLQTYIRLTAASDPNKDEDQHKIMAASGAIATASTLMMAFAERAPSPEAQQPLDQIVLRAIATMADGKHDEFFEELCQLVEMCTNRWISPPMWSALDLLYQGLRHIGLDYFRDVMPALVNFIRNGTEHFAQVRRSGRTVGWAADATRLASLVTRLCFAVTAMTLDSPRRRIRKACTTCSS